MTTESVSSYRPYFAVTIILTTTEAVYAREHRSERFRVMDMTISLIVFSFTILLNMAVLLYIKKKCGLHTSSRQLQFCAVVAMVLELVYRISTKVGYYSDWPSWTEKRILCYIMYPLYNGFTYGVRASFLLITIDAIIRLRRNDDAEFGLSKGAVKASILLIWLLSIAWGAMELFALGGEGITMKVNDITGKVSCSIQGRSVYLSTASFIISTCTLLIAIIFASMLLLILAICKKALGRFSIILIANSIQVCLDFPFIVVHTTLATDTIYNPDDDIWYDLYFLMKAAYLVVPLIWILPQDVNKSIRNVMRQFQSSSPRESPDNIDLKSEHKL